MKHPRKTTRRRRNPVFEEGDPLSTIDAYLDSGIWPGAAALDDLQIICEMYVTHYWREIEEFHPPVDLQEWVIERLPDDLQAVERFADTWASMTAEDAIEYYTERVRFYCARAKKAAKTWWKDLTYLLAMLVLGDDRMWELYSTGFRHSTGFRLKDEESWGLYPIRPPDWKDIIRTATRLGILGRVQGCHESRKRSLSTISVEHENRLLYLWYSDICPLMPYTDVGANTLLQANRQSLEELLSDIPYFDCQWCVRMREVIVSVPAGHGGSYPGVVDERRDFFLQMRRPSGWPTLLAYFYDWFWNFATKDDQGEDREPVTVPYDPELFSELLELAEEMLNVIQADPDEEPDEEPEEEDEPEWLDPEDEDDYPWPDD